MTGFPTVTLTSDQYTLLRGSDTVNPRYRCRVRISLCPNVRVVECRVNGTPTGSSFASFAYDGVTSGAIANVKVGQTIILSRTNDPRVGYFTGRIRELPSGSTSGTIYINETSAAITDNDYLFVIEDWRIWPILARDVSGVQYKDWDNTFASPPPFVSGIQTAYAGYVNPATGKLRIAFSASATAATSGATISSYAYTFGGVTTVISGATNTATVTVDFDPNDGVWNTLVVTDSGGRTTTRRFIVFAHDDDHPPFTGFDALQLNGDVDSGWSGSLTAFTDVDDVLDNTLLCVWVDEKYNSTSGSLFAGTNDLRNVVFVGRLRNEVNQSDTDERSGTLADVQFTLEDTAAQLKRLHGALIAEIIDASANEFDEIVNLTIWRGIVHLLGFHSTFLSLHDLTFDNTDNTYLCQGLRTQGDNLFDVISDLASSINAAMEFYPDGATRIIRNPYYKSTSDRDAMLILADLTNEDRTGYTLPVDPVLKVGQVNSDGGMYFNLGSINQVYPVLALAPGVAQDYPSQKASLTRQVLVANVDIGTAKTELKLRIGRKFAEENTTETLTVKHLGGYRCFVPSRGYWFTHAIAATTNVRGRVYTSSTRWLLRGINLNFGLSNGTCDVTGEYTPDINEDTIGASGDDLVYPDPDTTIYPELPTLPPFDPYPIPDDVPYDDPPLIEGDPFNPSPPPKNGNVVVIWDDDHVWITRKYLTATPIWNDITPGTDTVKACLFDPFPNATGLWVLESDGTDSWVWYTADPFEATPTWTQGAVADGLYTALRATDVSGGIMLYSPAADGGSWVETFDFTTGAHGWSAVNFFGCTTTYTPGVGFVSTPSGVAGISNLCVISRTISPTVVTFASLDYVAAGYFPGSTQVFALAWNDAAGTQGIEAASNIPATTSPVTQSISLNDSITTLNLRGQTNLGGSDIQTGTVTTTATTLAGTGVNPFGGGGNATVVYSTDNGATWTSPINAGASAGSIGGFDTQRVGDVSIAGTDAQAVSATTKGGAYTSLGSDGATAGSDPTLVLVPWGQWGAASSNNFSSSTPDYLLGSAALVSGECLWRVDGGGGRVDITPAGVTGIPTANCASTYLGTKLAVIASVSGTRHIFTYDDVGSGDTPTDRGAVGSNADFIRPLRLSKTLRQLFWVDGATAKFSADYAATIVTKNTPSVGTLKGIEVYG